MCWPKPPYPALLLVLLVELAQLRRSVVLVVLVELPASVVLCRY
jgi:hypothetical protein